MVSSLKFPHCNFVCIPHLSTRATCQA
jgi:hypothetical protein